MGAALKKLRPGVRVGARAGEIHNGSSIRPRAPRDYFACGTDENGIIPPMYREGQFSLFRRQRALPGQNKTFATDVYLDRRNGVLPAPQDEKQKQKKRAGVYVCMYACQLARSQTCTNKEKKNRAQMHPPSTPFHTPTDNQHTAFPTDASTVSSL